MDKQLNIILLPDSLFNNILENLSIKDLINTSCACKTLNWEVKNIRRKKLLTRYNISLLNRLFESWIKYISNKSRQRQYMCSFNKINKDPERPILLF